MKNCCKAYLLRQLRELKQWSEQMESARQTTMPIDAMNNESDRATEEQQELCNDTDRI